MNIANYISKSSEYIEYCIIQKMVFSNKSESFANIFITNNSTLTKQKITSLTYYN